MNENDDYPRITVRPGGDLDVELAPGTVGPFGVHDAGSGHPAGGTSEHPLAYIALVPLTLHSAVGAEKDGFTEAEFSRLRDLRRAGIASLEALDATELVVDEGDRELVQRALDSREPEVATRMLRPGDLLRPEEVNGGVHGLVLQHKVAALPTTTGVIGLLNLVFGEDE